jgi:lipopolysaccharide/colanic/teichoic acid biosynthesis glycosyltransferase
MENKPLPVGPLRDSAILQHAARKGAELRSFYRLGGKRLVDAALSAIGLIAACPIMILIGIAVKVSSRGHIFYMQDRVGRNGKFFRIVKFRSMREGADRSGLLLTASGDSRVTKIGAFLRRSKLDELPQLWNVLRGQMSLVGPRPETPGYVAAYNGEQRRVVSVRPGITDYASLLYYNEEEILARYPAPEEYYRQVLLPHKLSLNLQYIDQMSFSYDFLLLLRTAKSVLVPHGAPSRKV